MIGFRRFCGNTRKYFAATRENILRQRAGSFCGNVRDRFAATCGIVLRQRAGQPVNIVRGRSLTAYGTTLFDGTTRKCTVIMRMNDGDLCRLSLKKRNRLFY
jgi:hypothetical protein